MAFSQTFIRLAEEDGMDISPAPPPEDEMEMTDLPDDLDSKMHVLVDIDTDLRSDHSMMSVQSPHWADGDVELRDVDDTTPLAVPIIGSSFLDTFNTASSALHSQMFLQNSTAPSVHSSHVLGVGSQTFQPVMSGSLHTALDVDVDIDIDISTEPEPVSANPVSLPLQTTVADVQTPVVTLTVSESNGNSIDPSVGTSRFEIDYEDDASAANDEVHFIGKTDREEIEPAPEAVLEHSSHTSVAAETDAVEESAGGDARLQANLETLSNRSQRSPSPNLLAVPPGPHFEIENPHTDGSQLLSQARTDDQEPVIDVETEIDHSGDKEAEETQEPQQASGENLHLSSESGSQEEHSNHQITVVYEDLEISLFPPRKGDSSDTFFLQDESLLRAQISALFGGFRKVLSETITESEELEVFVDKIDLTIGEDHAASIEYSLYNILELFVRLHQNDGKECPALCLYLTTKPRFRDRVSYLKQMISDGKGISAVHAPDPLIDFESLDEDDEFPSGDVLNIKPAVHEGEDRKGEPAAEQEKAPAYSHHDDKEVILLLESDIAADSEHPTKLADEALLSGADIASEHKLDNHEDRRTDSPVGAVSLEPTDSHDGAVDPDSTLAESASELVNASEGAHNVVILDGADEETFEDLPEDFEEDEPSDGEAAGALEGESDDAGQLDNDAANPLTGHGKAVDEQVAEAEKKQAGGAAHDSIVLEQTDESNSGLYWGLSPDPRAADALPGRSEAEAGLLNKIYSTSVGDLSNDDDELDPDMLNLFAEDDKAFEAPDGGFVLDLEVPQNLTEEAVGQEDASQSEEAVESDDGERKPAEKEDYQVIIDLEAEDEHEDLGSHAHINTAYDAELLNEHSDDGEEGGSADKIDDAPEPDADKVGEVNGTEPDGVVDEAVEKGDKRADGQDESYSIDYGSDSDEDGDKDGLGADAHVDDAAPVHRLGSVRPSASVDDGASCASEGEVDDHTDSTLSLPGGRPSPPDSPSAKRSWNELDGDDEDEDEGKKRVKSG